jgi:hypothetical protein
MLIELLEVFVEVFVEIALVVIGSRSSKDVL